MTTEVVATEALVKSVAAELFADPGRAGELEWGRAALRFEPSAEFAAAVSPDAVDEWLDCSLLRHPYFEMGLHGVSVPAWEITSPRTVAKRAQPGYIDGAKVRLMFDRGATLMVSNLHHWHRPCQAMCQRLSDALQAKVGASAFYTPATRDGLVVHRDDAHVFVVQIAGTKRWSLYDVPADPSGWTKGEEPQAGTPELTIELAPGDGLYVPEGQAHAATSLDQPSLHLSITVREPRVHDLVARAVQAALADVGPHASLTGDPEARLRAAATVLRDVAARLTDLDPRTIL